MTMGESSKFSMFGKTYNGISDCNTNLCLCTKGDVKIKTPNRFITIFKDGKLAVGDFNQMFAVNSVGDIKKNGMYLVTETDDDGNEMQSVYLCVDGMKILLTSSNVEYLSYNTEQDLSADQITLALGNIGLYFDTLADAQASGIQNGMVYITSEGTLYKVVDGVFSVMFEDTDTDTVADHEHSYDQLQIGGIFIDGINQVINADGSLLVQVDGRNYVWFKYGEICIMQDVVFDNSITIKNEGAVEGESGLLIYVKDGQTYLETDYLIVHNKDGSFEPELFTVHMGCEVKNMVKSASWNDDGNLKVELKYINQFEVGDYVLMQVGGGNQATVDYHEENGKWYVEVRLEHVPTQVTRIDIWCETQPANDDSETTSIYVASVTIDPSANLDDDYSAHGSAELTNLASNYIVVGIERIDVDGDDDIYYVSEGGNTSGGYMIPTPHIGKVTGTNPLVVDIDLGTTDDYILNYLPYTPVYRYAARYVEEYPLYHVKGNLTLLRTSATDGERHEEVHTHIGNLSVVQKPEGNGEDLDGFGIYSDRLVAILPEFYGASFTGSVYPVYDELLALPNGNYDAEEYNQVIPDIAWVKELLKVSAYDDIPLKNSVLEFLMNVAVDAALSFNNDTRELTLTMIYPNDWDSGVYNQTTANKTVVIPGIDDEYLYEYLKEHLATINGNVLYEGGDIQVTGGGTIDLSDYVTKEDLANDLSNYVTSSELGNLSDNILKTLQELTSNFGLAFDENTRTLTFTFGYAFSLDGRISDESLTVVIPCNGSGGDGGYTEGQIKSWIQEALDGYATEDFVKDYVDQHSGTGYTEDEINALIEAYLTDNNYVTYEDMVEYVSNNGSGYDDVPLKNRIVKLMAQIANESYVTYNSSTGQLTIYWAYPDEWTNSGDFDMSSYTKNVTISTSSGSGEGGGTTDLTDIYNRLSALEEHYDSMQELVFSINDILSDINNNQLPSITARITTIENNYSSLQTLVYSLNDTVSELLNTTIPGINSSIAQNTSDINTLQSTVNAQQQTIQEMLTLLDALRYGSASDPVILISGKLTRVNGGTTWSFSGSRKDRISSVSISNVDCGAIFVEIASSYTLNILSVQATQALSGATYNTGNSIIERNYGAHWFEASVYAQGTSSSTLRIREFHNGNDNNDSWETDDTVSNSKAIREINLTVLGYVS